jgi:release factor glutamine methyltransferase
MADATGTIGAALAETRTALQAAGIESAALDARLLVAAALDARVESVIAWPERAVPTEAVVRLGALVQRRVAREPMAYILGRREFWSLDFAVTPATLTPRPDSETLVSAVLGAVPDGQATLRLVDFGVGTGCLLLSLLSELPSAHGLGIDRDPATVDVARTNALRLNLVDRASFAQGDWGCGLSGPFDVVVSNPPYIATADLATLGPELGYEPRLALDGGTDGLDAYRALIPDAARLLRAGGLIALEIGAGQASQVQQLLTASGFSPVEAHKDLAGVVRCLLARRGPPV